MNFPRYQPPATSSTRCAAPASRCPKRSAEDGLAWGAFNQVREPGQAMADNGPLSTRQAKQSIHDGLQMDLLAGYRFEIEACNRLVDTEDRREGVRAFNEKRKPVFTGR